jgi:hypothetical protein
MRNGALALVVVLTVLHQDFWLWDDPTLVGGFLPAGLAWHAAFSFAAVAVWALVVRFAWPADPFAGEEQA